MMANSSSPFCQPSTRQRSKGPPNVTFYCYEAKWQRQGVLYTAAEGSGVRLVLPGLGV
jgi:hypothetical protein